MLPGCKIAPRKFTTDSLMSLISPVSVNPFKDIRLYDIIENGKQTCAGILRVDFFPDRYIPKTLPAWLKNNFVNRESPKLKKKYLQI